MHKNPRQTDPGQDGGKFCQFLGNAGGGVSWHRIHPQTNTRKRQAPQPGIASVPTVTRVVTRVVEFPRGPRGHFCHFEFLLQLLKKTKARQRCQANFRFRSLTPHRAEGRPSLLGQCWVQDPWAKEQKQADGKRRHGRKTKKTAQGGGASQRPPKFSKNRPPAALRGCD